MGLSDLRLRDFRNHADTALAETGQFNLLLGENGAGKTNVLEALSLLAPGRGMRRAGVEEMARQVDGASGTRGAGAFGIGASLLVPGGEPVRLATYTEAARPRRRLVRINGAAASALGLAEWLAVTWLTPAMDRLFAEGASARRQFLDRLAVATEPSHASASARYAAAVRERNRLLADEATPDPLWLDGLETQMALHGAAVAGTRERLIARLTEQLAREPEHPFPRPALRYVAGGPADEAALAQALRQGRGADRAARRSLIGPHRDDLAVTLEAKGVPAEQCSTGEQKAMLIALVLAHASLAGAGRQSVLLLDEVAAHLDPVRREALFDRLRTGPAQVWMTGTEAAPFSALAGDVRTWQVRAGEVLSV